MALLVIEHDPAETTGRLGQTLRDHGHRLNIIALDRGASLPPDLDDLDGLIIMGGPQNADETAKFPYLADELDFIKRAHNAKLPIVGICLGAQLIAAALGGEVKAMPQREVGWHPLKLAFPGTIDPLYAGIPWDSMQVHLHGQEVTKLPPGGTPLASSKMCKLQAFKLGLTTYAFQYHLEYDRKALSTHLNCNFSREAGLDPQDAARQTQQHYDAYDRLSDRLCENIALLLFPIDKRIATRETAGTH
jgi:GMP synthase (glutamine-hydrolysing)